MRPDHLRPSTARELILAAARQPWGTSRREVRDKRSAMEPASRAILLETLLAMAQAGELLVATRQTKIGGPPTMRYFAKREAAAAWARGEVHEPARQPRLKDPSDGPSKHLRGERRRTLSAGGKPFSGEPIVTRAPAPAFDARYQVDPASRPAGAGFAKLGIGRYFTDEGAAA